MKYIILIGLLGIVYFSPAQIETTKRTTEVYDFEVSNPSLRSIAIPVDFNDDNLLAQIPDSLNNLAIQRVDLVYTTYALNPNFDQVALNKSRLSELQKKWPESKNKSIYWQEVGQTYANSPKSAKEMFHGFIIYYRPTPTHASMKAEIDFIDAIISGKGLPTSKKPAPLKETLSSEKKDDVALVPTKTTFDEVPKEFDLKVGECYEVFEQKGTCTKEQIAKLQDSISLLKNYSGHKLNWTSEESSSLVVYDVTWLRLSDECDYDKARTTSDPIFGNWLSAGDYDVVKSVYERNSEWNNTHIVMDVTGSMSPYIVQTMVWLKNSQQEELVSAFTFFNDGNMTPDNSKITGKVGGIYSIENSNFNTVYQELKSTMEKGGGGDTPENNIEATLSGLKAFPNCKEIIMVADNFASPRDLELVKNLNIPVHVIICGASYGGINIDYIQLAYDTGGTVHTIQEDLDMKNLQTNKTVKIGQHYYTILDGKVIHAENKA